jgi:WD40 repeat protein
MRIDLSQILTDEEKAIAAEDECIKGLAFAPDGRALVVAFDKRLLMFSLPTGHLQRELACDPKTFDVPRGWFELLEFTPDGRWLVTASDEGNGGESWSYLCSFETATGRCVVAPLKNDYLSNAALEPSGNRVAVVTQIMRRLSIHEVTTGRELAALDDEQTEFFAVAWDPISGNLIVSTGLDEMREYHPDTLKLIRSITVPPMPMLMRLLFPRTKQTLAPELISLPNFQPVSLPSGSVFWADLNGDERPLWLSADGASALFGTQLGSAFVQASGARDELSTLFGDLVGERVPWLAAASVDGKQVAMAQGAVVHIESVEEQRARNRASNRR